MKNDTHSFFLSKMTKVPFLALFLLNSFLLNAQKIKIGTTFKDIDEFSGFINQSSAAVNLHFGVNYVKSFSEEHFLVVSRFEDGVFGTNDYQMRVIRIVDIPPFKEEYFRVMIKNCSLNGRSDDALFALVVAEEKRQLTNVIKVWKLNRRTGEVITIGTSGVSCYNEDLVTYSGN